MKRTFVILCILLFVGSAIGIQAENRLKASAETVVWQETTLFGDKKMAEGLSIETDMQYNSHLLWETKLVFGKDMIETASVHSYSSKEVSFVSYPFYGQEGECSLYSGLPFFCSNGEPPYIPDHLKAAYEELVQETHAEEAKTKQIRLADYMPYYKISGEIRLPDTLGREYCFDVFDKFARMDDPELYRVYQGLSDYFKIPVLSDEYYRISVEKDDNGNWIAAEGDGAEIGDRYEFYTTAYAVDENAFYFGINIRTQKGALADLSQMEGYGIYRLPFGRFTEYKEDGSLLNDYPSLFPEQLKLWYPLPVTAEVTDMMYDPDNHQLLLHVLEEGCYYVLVIDMETGKTLQTIPLYEEKEGRFVYVIEKEGYQIITAGDDLFIIEETDGVWSVTMQVSRTKELDLESMHASWCGEVDLCVWAYDGERLAIVRHIDIQQEEENRIDQGCSLVVSVYKEDGLAYYGIIESSLNQSNHKQNPQKWMTALNRTDDMFAEWVD